jgi:hypothetical protein
MKRGGIGNFLVKMCTDDLVYYLLSKSIGYRFGLVWWFLFMVFNDTFNSISVISWLSVLLVEETGESHRPVASH